MKKTMLLKYNLAEKAGYISVSVSGHFSLEVAKKMYIEALEKLLPKKHSNLFFNVSKVKGKVTTMDRYHFGESAALESIKYMEKGLQRITVAFYGIEPIIDPERFGELVARNRGLNIKVTTNKNEALQFLEVK